MPVKLCPIFQNHIGVSVGLPYTVKGLDTVGATGDPLSSQKHCNTCYHVQIGPGTNEAAYLMGTGDSFKGQRR